LEGNNKYKFGGVK